MIDRNSRLACIALAFAAAFAMTPACTTPIMSDRAGAPPPTISKIESRELPPAVVTDRIARQLAEILILTPAGTPGVPPVRPLQDVWFWTTPRATTTPDVCQTDQVVFYFSHAGRDDRDAGSPTRVSGISASPRYHLLAPPPPGPPAYLTEAGTADLNRRCAALDPDSIHTVSAMNPDHVPESARLYARLTGEAFNRDDVLEHECFRETHCAEELADLRALTFADVQRVDACELPAPAADARCTRFGVADFIVDAYTHSKSQRTVIDKVKVRRVIVLGTGRID